MSAEGWSAVAAWVGALLGVWSFVAGWVSRRPVMYIDPDGDAGGVSDRSVLIRIEAGEQPIFVRSVRLIPGAPGADSVTDMDAATMRATAHTAFLWSRERVFRKRVAPKATGTMRVHGIATDKATLILVRWSDQRLQVLPWTAFLVTPRRLREFADAAR